jgi:hypothetical protein
MNKTLSLRKRLGLELYRKIHRNKVELHELNTLFWECTLRCNLSCLHCGSDCRSLANQKDMPVSDFLRVYRRNHTQVNPNHTMIILRR